MDGALGSMIEFLMFAAAWFGCGLAGAGWLFAYFQGEYPFSAEASRSADGAVAMLAVVFGPISMVASLICLHSFADEGQSPLRHGWRLW